MIRLCDGRTSWDNWYEIQLTCGTVSSLSVSGSTLLDANFLTVEDGVSEAMLVITVESDTGSSDTCSFPCPTSTQLLHVYWNIVKIALWTPYHSHGPIVELSVVKELG